MQVKIPILDLQPEIKKLLPDLLKEIETVIKSGSFIFGPNVKKLQSELCQYFGVKHSIPVNSGTDALVISLRSSGIQSGDEIITSSFSFFATSEAISIIGAKPIFVDIDSDTFNLDPKLIEEKINSKTKAILPVHLFGQPAQMPEIVKIAKKYNLKIIEDVAQAFGAECQNKKVGTLGDLGAFSFFPSKNLGAYGDGGLIITDNPDFAQQAQMLALHGSKKKYCNEIVGYNSRLDEIQAAILRIKLPLIETYNKQRKAVAKEYNALFSETTLSPNFLEVPSETDHAKHVYHQYTIRVKKNLRDKLKAELEQRGIQTMIYYPTPIHLSDAYKRIYSGLFLPKTVEASKEVLSLPIWPQINKETIKYVVKTIQEILLGQKSFIDSRDKAGSVKNESGVNLNQVNS